MTRAATSDAGLAPQRRRRDLSLRVYAVKTVSAVRDCSDAPLGALRARRRATCRPRRPAPIASVTARSPTSDVQRPPGHQRTASRGARACRAGRDGHAAEAERERLAEPSREEEALGRVEVRIGVHVPAVVRVHLEVEVVVPLRVARVAVPGDLLAGRHLRAVLDGVRDVELAAAAVLGPLRQVVVEVDIEVCRAALAVEVEHAAGTRRGRATAPGPPRPRRPAPATGGSRCRCRRDCR